MDGLYRGSVAGFQQGEEPRRRFPALDPEPPPLPWWRRLIMPACMLAGVAVVVTAVRVVPPLLAGSPASRAPAAGGPGRRPAGPPVRAAGRVVFITGSGSLALANPDGTHVIQAAGLGNVGDAVAASPDGKYIALLNGQMISISSGPALASYPGRIELSSNTTVTLPYPFADHEKAVAMLQDFGDPAYSSTNPISVVSIATGRSVSLGSGDQVAGDPAAKGVFTTVSAPLPAHAVSLQTTADATVVLRDAGRRPVRLATAGELGHDVGLPRRLALSLAVYPSPSGAEAAVTARPAGGGSGGGMVILTRSGRMLAALPVRGGAGPALSAPVWSPSGASLAYLGTSSSAAPRLSVWSAGLPAVVSSTLPSSAGRYGACVWSPDGTSVLCPAGGGSEWLVTPAGGGQPAAAPGPGLPVAWLR